MPRPNDDQMTRITRITKKAKGYAIWGTVLVSVVWFPGPKRYLWPWS
jgi:hypothetical protein